MAGVVLLGGGGDAQAEREVWRHFASPDNRMLYWPFALDGDMLQGAARWFTTQLKGMGIAAPRVETWTTLAEHEPTELAEFDVPCVGGGNTFALLNHLQRHRFTNPVREWVASGGTYYGGSAGALLATTSIAVCEHEDTNDVGLTDTGGLGFLPTRGLLPHYTPGKLALAHRLATEFRTPIVGVPENGGLILRDGLVLVAGPAPVSVISEDSVRSYRQGDSISSGVFE